MVGVLLKTAMVGLGVKVGRDGLAMVVEEGLGLAAVVASPEISVRTVSTRVQLNRKTMPRPAQVRPR